MSSEGLGTEQEGELVEDYVELGLADHGIEDGQAPEALDVLQEAQLDQAVEDALNLESGFSAEQDELLNQLNQSFNVDDDVNVQQTAESFGFPDFELESGLRHPGYGSTNAKESETTPSCLTPARLPDTGVIAQVILICTSLGSIRRQFFSSRRAKQLLDCKGIPYFVIDANRDVSQGANLKDQILLQDWTARQLLAYDGGENSKFTIPQVLIDGVAIGNEIALQDMEEDGDLDWAFARAACPACLHERNPASLSCGNCGVEYVELIDDTLVQEQSVQRLLRGQLFWGSHQDALVSSAPLYSDLTARPSDQGEPEALTYETLFGEAPPEDATVV